MAIQLLQSKANFSSVSNNILSVNVNPTTSNSLIVVMIGVIDYSISTTQVTDNTLNTYISAGARTTYNISPTFYTDIWYGRSINSGATTITVTFSNIIKRRYVWVFEVTGIDISSPLETIGTVQQIASPVLDGGSVITTSSNTFIASCIMSTQMITGILAGNEFTLGEIIGEYASPYLNANSYLISSNAGVHTPTWTSSTVPAGYCSSTAAFKADTGCEPLICNLSIL